MAQTSWNFLMFLKKLNNFVTCSSRRDPFMDGVVCIRYLQAEYYGTLLKPLTPFSSPFEDNLQMPLKREWVEEAIREDNPNLKIIRFDEVSSEDAAGAGDNYMSTIKRTQIDVVLEDGKTVRLPLIVKEMSISDNSPALLASGFATEIKVYRDILPFLAEVMAEQDIQPPWARFFGVKENFMFFSDLKAKGYELRDRIERLDMEHAMLAVRSLAQFHAASVVLNERGKLEVDGLEPPFHIRSTIDSRNYRKSGLKVGARVIIDEWGSEWSEIGNRLLENVSLSEQVEKLAELNGSALNVLTHGDLWTTNMLFKYTKSLKTPISVRFVDFQLSTYTSYGFDLVFLLASSIPAELRRKSKVTILRSYAAALKRALDAYNLPHLAPSLEEIIAEVKRLDVYFLYILFTELPVMIADRSIENPLDMSQFGKDGDAGFSHNPKLYFGQFKEEVSQELLQWAEEGLF